MNIFGFLLDTLKSAKRGVHRKMGGSQSPKRRALRVESLESRQLLAVTLAETAVTWDLADYDYSQYEIDYQAATETTDAKAVLFGVANGTQTTLAETTDFASGIKIVGDDATSETITVTADAMMNLSALVFDGGSENNDVVTLLGSENADRFTIDSFTVETETENTDSGSDSSRGGNRNWDGWDHDDWDWGDWGCRWGDWDWKDGWRKESRTVSTEWATVDFTWAANETSQTGASLQLTGMAAVNIDGSAGSDTFAINTLATDFRLIHSDGDDSLDFSSAETESGRSSRWDRWNSDWSWNHGDWGWDCGDWGWNHGDWGWGHGDWGWGHGQKTNGITIDLDSADWQSVSSNWSGKLQLDGDFKELTGSARNDRITGSNITVTENAGANVVKLTGGDNAVTATGDRNSVTASGSGSNTITISGSRSRIDLTQTDSDAENSVAVSGDRNTVRGGDAADIITVSGSGNRANLGGGNDQATVTGDGSGNRIDGGSGDDLIWAVNSTGRNSYWGGSGNDMIFGGSGNDRIFGGDGRDLLVGSAGADALFGDRDCDILLANRTEALDDMESWTDTTRDDFLAQIYQSWVTDKDEDATIELLGESSIADNARDRILLGQDDGNLVYYNSSEGDRYHRHGRKSGSDRIFDGA